MNSGINNCTGYCSGGTSSRKFGYGMQFDGMNDYIDTNGENLSPTSSTDITIESWFKTTIAKERSTLEELDITPNNEDSLSIPASDK